MYIRVAILLSSIVFTSASLKADGAPPKPNIVPFIIGGDLAHVPWQASLQYVWGENQPNCTVKGGPHFCGGAIIGNNWILSAAHCTEGLDKLKQERIHVRVGNTECSKGGALYKVKRYFHHKKYIPNPVFDYDFALFELSDEIQFNKDTKPIKLADANYHLQDGRMCSVSGWGWTMSQYESREMLRSVNVPIINQTICTDYYKNFTITPRMFCAGYESGGKDACKADSGGPIVVRDNGDPILVGVVSWGYGCAYARKPGVYARVSSVRDWIREHTGI